MCLSRILGVTLAVAVSVALGANCPAQEIASVDLTKVAARTELRRPTSTQEVSGGLVAGGQDVPCPLGQDIPGISVNPVSTKNAAVELRTTLTSLDRTHFKVEEAPTFEVTVENVGSTPVKIPISPHWADLQPKNPAQKFAYSELALILWVAGTEGGSSTSGGITLYGADDRPDSILTLNLGEWVRIVGKGTFNFHPAPRGKGPVHPDAINRAYAQVILYRAETLLTAKATATVRHEICVRQTYGRAFPIALTGAAE